MKFRKLNGKLRKQMEAVLDTHRMDHTLGVAYTAAALAFVHDCDLEQAMTAGMLHDCAKCLSDSEMLSECKRYGIAVSEPEESEPSLLHAKLGAYYAENRYGVTDEAVLDAIRCHTTGKPDMNLLEKILFVADYIEPNRKELPALDDLRKEAFTDLDLCVFHILTLTLEYLKEKAKVQDPMTGATLDFYGSLLEKRDN